jgi:hypothetical protein
VNSRSNLHQQAHGWLTRRLAGTGTVGLAWTVLLGFVRIGTSPSILPNPITSDQAFDIAAVPLPPSTATSSGSASTW